MKRLFLYLIIFFIRLSCSDNKCYTDLDCKWYSYCFKNSCTSQCVADYDCPNGYFCHESGRCLMTGGIGPVPGNEEGLSIDDTGAAGSDYPYYYGEENDGGENPPEDETGDPAGEASTLPDFEGIASLLITELSVDRPQKDLIELFVLAAGRLMGITIIEWNGNDKIIVFPDIPVNAGDFIVVHLNAAQGEEFPLTHNFYSPDSGLIGTDNILLLCYDSKCDYPMDIIAYSDGDLKNGQKEKIEALILLNHWSKDGPDVTPVDLADSSNETYKSSIYRVWKNGSPVDTNSKADWQSTTLAGGAPTWGAANTEN